MTNQYLQIFEDCLRYHISSLRMRQDWFAEKLWGITFT